MHKFSPLLEFGVHDQRHEVVVEDHSLEHGLHEHLFGVVLVLGLLSFLLLSLATIVLGVLLLLLFESNLLLDIVLESLEQRLVPVCHGKVCNTRPILHKLEKILVVLDGLLSDAVIHRCHGEPIDLLNDGVALLAILLLFLFVYCLGLLLRRKVIRLLVSSKLVKFILIRHIFIIK